MAANLSKKFALLCCCLMTMQALRLVISTAGFCVVRFHIDCDLFNIFISRLVNAVMMSQLFGNWLGDMIVFAASGRWKLIATMLANWAEFCCFCSALICICHTECGHVTGFYWSMVCAYFWWKVGEAPCTSIAAPNATDYYFAGFTLSGVWAACLKGLVMRCVTDKGVGTVSFKSDALGDVNVKVVGARSVKTTVDYRAAKWLYILTILLAALMCLAWTVPVAVNGDTEKVADEVVAILNAAANKPKLLAAIKAVDETASVTGVTKVEKTVGKDGVEITVTLSGGTLDVNWGDKVAELAVALIGVLEPGMLKKEGSSADNAAKTITIKVNPAGVLSETTMATAADGLAGIAFGGVLAVPGAMLGAGVGWALTTILRALRHGNKTTKWGIGITLALGLVGAGMVVGLLAAVETGLLKGEWGEEGSLAQVKKKLEEKKQNGEAVEVKEELEKVREKLEGTQKVGWGGVAGFGIIVPLAAIFIAAFIGDSDPYVLRGGSATKWCQLIFGIVGALGGMAAGVAPCVNEKLSQVEGQNVKGIWVEPLKWPGPVPAGGTDETGTWLTALAAMIGLVVGLVLGALVGLWIGACKGSKKRGTAAGAFFGSFVGLLCGEMVNGCKTDKVKSGDSAVASCGVFIVVAGLGTVFSIYPGMAPCSITQFKYFNIIDILILVLSAIAPLVIMGLDLGNSEVKLATSILVPANNDKKWTWVGFGVVLLIATLVCEIIVLSIMQHPHSKLAQKVTTSGWRAVLLTVTMVTCQLVSSGIGFGCVAAGSRFNDGVVNVNSTLTLWSIECCGVLGEGYLTELKKYEPGKWPTQGMGKWATYKWWNRKAFSNAWQIWCCIGTTDLRRDIMLCRQ